MTTLSGGQAATGVAGRIVNVANTLLDRYLPAKPGDLKDTGEIRHGMHSKKMTSL